MKLLLQILSVSLVFLLLVNSAQSGAVTGSRNKCFNIGKRFDAHARVKYYYQFAFFTDKFDNYQCSNAYATIYSYNSSYAHAQVGLSIPTRRIMISKWNAIAGEGYRIPLIEPTDSYGVSKGDNGETVTFDSANHSIRLSDFHGRISATLGTGYGSTLMYVIWTPETEDDSIISANEVLNKGRVSIENGQLVTDGFFSPSDFNVTIVPDSTSPSQLLNVSPSNQLTKTIQIGSSTSLDSVKVSVFLEGGYGNFIEEDIIHPPELTLVIKLFNEGYYDPNLNSMRTGDSVKVFLHSPDPPYETTDSCVVFTGSNGMAVLRKRESPTRCCPKLSVFFGNSIETWSSGELDSSGGYLHYDFTTNSSAAYGDNMILVDSNPLVYALYSGDTNRDGTIDATDVSAVDNDAANFISGHVVTDLTGDDFVDGTDFAIADNNAANFVSVIGP